MDGDVREARVYVRQHSEMAISTSWELAQSQTPDPGPTASESGWAQQRVCLTSHPLHSGAHESLRNTALSPRSKFKSTSNQQITHMLSNGAGLGLIRDSLRTWH